MQTKPKYNENIFISNKIPAKVQKFYIIQLKKSISNIRIALVKTSEML